jgi:hypothetical protein
MSLLRALFGGGAGVSSGDAGTPSTRIAPTDQRLRCDCGSNRPLEPIRTLVSFAIRQAPGVEPTLIEQQDGATALCHNCDRMLDVTSHGVFVIRGPKAAASPDTATAPPAEWRPPTQRTPLDRSPL